MIFKWWFPNPTSPPLSENERFLRFVFMTGMALSRISFISSVQLTEFVFCFCHTFFMLTILGFPCRINFHIRSNLGIMAGSLDTVKQSES